MKVDAAFTIKRKAVRFRETINRNEGGKMRERSKSFWLVQRQVPTSTGNT